MYSLTVVETGSPRSRYQLVGVWLELCPWVADGCFLSVSSYGRERALVSLPLLKGHQPYQIRVPPYSLI